MLCLWYTSKWLCQIKFQRERPETAVGEGLSYSFPSGQAMAAFAMYGVLIYLLRGHIRSSIGRALFASACVLMVLGIGLSRIYVGDHYPGDIIGGYLAGGVWPVLCIGVFEHWRDIHEAKREKKYTAEPGATA